jgi:hypothetical protein
MLWNKFILTVKQIILKSFTSCYNQIFLLKFFFIWILGSGVHTGSTRHCGHSWSIVSASCDCEDGEVGGMNGFDTGNRSTLRKPAPTPLCPPQIPLARPRRPGRHGLIRSRARYFSLFHSVQADSKAHPQSSPTGIKGNFSGGQEGGCSKLTTHLHLVPRSRIVELYLRSPACLLGWVLSYLRTGTILSLINIHNVLKIMSVTFLAKVSSSFSNFSTSANCYEFLQFLFSVSRNCVPCRKIESMLNIEYSNLYPISADFSNIIHITWGSFLIQFTWYRNQKKKKKTERRAIAQIGNPSITLRIDWNE